MSRARTYGTVCLSYRRRKRS